MDDPPALIPFYVIYGAIASWLMYCIPNPGVPGSTPLSGSKFHSAFHPSEWLCSLEIVKPNTQKGATRFKLLLFLNSVLLTDEPCCKFMLKYNIQIYFSQFK